MTTKIEDLMRRQVFTIEMDDPISMAQARMESASIHHLPVVDSAKKIVGIVSDRDLLRIISPFLNTPSEVNRDRSVMRRPVHQVMTRSPHTVVPETLLEEAARLMLDSNISSLPVSTEKGKLVGILTWKDIVEHCVVLSPS